MPRTRSGNEGVATDLNIQSAIKNPGCLLSRAAHGREAPRVGVRPAELLEGPKGVLELALEGPQQPGCLQRRPGLDAPSRPSQICALLWRDVPNVGNRGIGKRSNFLVGT